MQLALQLNDVEATTAPCPKCGTLMILAAVTPHPIAPRMQRHTFLCTTCNQTKTYMIQVKVAAAD